MAVKATFRLARRVCPAHAGWNYLHGICGDEPRLGPCTSGVPTGSLYRHRRHGAHVCGLLLGAVLHALAAYARKVSNRHLLERPSPTGGPGMRAVSSQLEPHAGPTRSLPGIGACSGSAALVGRPSMPMAAEG